MQPVAVLRLPVDTDLSAFVALLERLDVPHRVSEEAGEQVLWVSAGMVEQVRGLYTRFPVGDGQSQLTTKASTPGLLGQLKNSPSTAAMLALTLVVAGVTLLGANFAAISWLSFQDFQIQGDYIVFTPLADSLLAGQWWRLLTPMLIHFGILHLAMNALWYWELGRRIEARQGGLMLLALTLLFSLVSNLAQYSQSGPSLFGGLSGVLYGLLGHCWIFQKLAPSSAFRLPQGVLVMMLVWLLLCLSGLITALGFGAIANAAHVGGLLIGCLTGLLGGALARSRR